MIVTLYVTLYVSVIFISLRTLRSLRCIVYITHRKGRKDRKAELDYVLNWVLITMAIS
jgi:hypothetical protein